MDINAAFEKAERLLEFGRIRERVAERALSAEAAELIRTDAPLTDTGAAAEQKALVSAICDLINEGNEVRLELPETGALLPKLGVEGASLDIDEAFALGLFAERGEAFRAWLLSSGAENLRALAEDAPSCAAVRDEVFNVLDRDGKVKDTGEIKKIRQRIRDLSRGLENLAAGFAADEQTRRMLQSPLPSQRDGRLVLAVKANFRGRIKGIVHEVSATGQTVFVEPAESVEKNNLLLVENGNLEMEIRKLLRELTARLSPRREALEAFRLRILRLETLRAKARYSLDTRGCFAVSGTLRLRAARHPLIEAAVPVDIALSPETRVAIITGPNTGGKTAALKTIGLFALMNQTGLALPAGEGTGLPVFDAVFADIGDEQSISQSLSTFSAHMVNIAAIAASASERSLVLLDELGSGTDPEEGGAIAMAILDHLLERKSTALITTHHGALKNYGYGREGVENASVEFDGRTLSPTYRIIMGIPGESRALEIAARNGLPPELVERARGYLDGERADMSALIAGLREKNRLLDEASRKAGLEEARLREERRKSGLKELSLRQREHLLKEQGAAEFRRLLEESRKKLENLVRELREGEMSRDKTLRVKEFIRELEADSAAIDAAQSAARAGLESAAQTPDIGLPAAPLALEAGREVLAGPSRRRGQILRPDNKSGRAWIVQIGPVKMSFPESELIPLESSPSEQKPLISASGITAASEAKLELSLRGLRLDEALDALRRQIDAAVLAGLAEFAVVHGKGDGILRKGVHDFLETEAAVAEYRFSRPELGGFGRTEVTLKR